MIQRRLVRLAAIAIGSATLIAAALMTTAHWRAIRTAAGDLRLAWLLAGVAALAACYGILCLAWSLLLRSLGATISSRDAFRAYALSQLPKYLPGRIVGHGVRVAATVRLGVPTWIAITSLVLDGIASIGVGTVVAVAGTLLGEEGLTPDTARWLILLLLVGTLIAAVATFARLPEGRWQALIGLPTLRRNQARLPAIVALYLIAWCLLGTAYWLIANAVEPLGVSHLIPVTVAVAVATGLGQLAIIAPAGVGVREGALFLFAQAWMGAPSALVFVALCRLLSVVIEATLTAIAALYASAGSEAAEAPPA
jgi:hypothetical protein